VWPESSTDPADAQPGNDESDAEVTFSTPADVAAAFERARKVQPEWAATDVRQRAQVMLDLHDLVLDRQDEILDLIQGESGKARKHAFEEVAHVAMTARYYGLTAQHQLRSQRRMGAFPGLTSVRVNRVPKGVVGIISPWNYPFTLALSDGLPALVAGNAVVSKPDTLTTLTAFRGVELLREAGLPDDLWQVVSGSGPVVGGALIDQADYLCFTGSTSTGRVVAAQAGQRLIGCSLELGGKNPMLVLRDASINRAAEGAVRACFSSAGQLCVSMERLFVADEIYDRFLAAFLTRVNAMRLAADFSFQTDMGSMVSQAQLATVAEHVDDAVAKGARVLTGGRPRPDIGPLFYEPTVLEGVRPGMTVFADESFGPVVSVYSFTDEADAVSRANEGGYGLNASVYTRDVRRGRRIAASIRCGTVNINEGYAPTFASIDSPMGGMRDSGLGRRQGPEGIHRYTDPQAVASQRVRVAPVGGLSDETYARSMTGLLRLLKRVRRP
jgi:acyl-CoA reductase-like NAD-dependent aldehyde dehydrogenase